MSDNEEETMKSAMGVADRDRPQDEVESGDGNGGDGFGALFGRSSGGDGGGVSVTSIG